MPKHFYLIILLLIFSVAGCQQSESTAPTGEDTFASSFAKAKEWHDKQVHGLAEAEVRKALQVEPENKEAQMLLFQSLVGQTEDKTKLNEALELGEKLSATLAKDSPEREKVDSYLQEQASKERLGALAESVKNKDGKAAELLAAVPEEQRDGNYWRLAYLHHKEGKDIKATAKVAKEWLKSQPTGLDAKDAQNLLEELEMGLLDGPEAAFASFRKADSKKRKAYLRDQKASLDMLNDLLSKSKVVGVKKEKSTLRVSLQFTNPYSKKPATKAILLPYKQVEGRWRLAIGQADLGAAAIALGDPTHTLSPTLHQLSGLWAENYDNHHRAFYRKVLGKEKVLRDNSPVKALSTEVLFDSLYIKYSEPHKGKERLMAITITGPKYRTREGLGVGNHLNDFRPFYRVKKKRAYGSVLFPPMTPSGRLKNAGYAIAGKKGNFRRGAVLLLDKQDFVIGIQFLTYNYVQGM